MLRRVLALATLAGVLAGCSDDGPAAPESPCPSPVSSAPSDMPSAPPATAGAPRTKMDRPLGGRVRVRPTGASRPRATTGQQHPPVKPTKRRGVDLDDDQPQTVTETVVCSA